MRNKFKIFQFNVILDSISSALSPNPIECNTTMFPLWLSKVCKKKSLQIKTGMKFHIKRFAFFVGLSLT